MGNNSIYRIFISRLINIMCWLPSMFKRYNFPTIPFICKSSDGHQLQQHPNIVSSFISVSNYAAQSMEIHSSFFFALSLPSRLKLMLFASFISPLHWVKENFPSRRLIKAKFDSMFSFSDDHHHYPRVPFCRWLMFLA